MSLDYLFLPFLLFNNLTASVKIMVLLPFLYNLQAYYIIKKKRVNNFYKMFTLFTFFLHLAYGSRYFQWFYLFYVNPILHFFATFRGREDFAILGTEEKLRYGNHAFMISISTLYGSAPFAFIK